MLGTIKTVGPGGKTNTKCRGRGIASAPVRYARDHWRTLAVSAASTWLFRAVCVTGALAAGAPTAGTGALLVGATCSFAGAIIGNALKRTVDEE